MKITQLLIELPAKALVRVMSVIVLLLSFNLQAGEKINEVVEAQSDGQVSIESMRGVVEIVGWEKNQVSVSGELDDKATGYTFKTENGFTVFKVNMPKNNRSSDWSRSDGSDLKIFLPVGSDLTFESVNGDVSVKAVSGGTNLHTVNGSIEAVELSGQIRLATVNGSIKSSQLNGKIKLATVNGRVKDENSKGKVHYETVNGKIIGNTQANRVYVENVNGKIELTLKQVEELEIGTVNGDIDASLSLTSDGNVNVTTVSGDAKLSFAGDVGGHFRLQSHAGGRIKNRLTDDAVKKQKYGPARSLKFSKEGGNAKVEMTSVSGNLTIEDQ